MRDCDTVADNMMAYQKLYNTLEGGFDGCELNYITRANNTEADELANIGSTRELIPPGVFLESISQRSIKTKALSPEAVTEDDDTSEPAQVAAANPADDSSSQAVEDAEPAALEGPSWEKPFLRFLIEGTLPQDVAEARRISRRSKAFTVINKQLYKCSISQVLQKCIDEEDGKAQLLEIHDGICGHHASSRALVSKAFRAGFYWPTAIKTRRKSYDVASPARSSPTGCTPPPQNSRLYHYPGRSPPGDSTWWAHSRNHQRVEGHTCSS